MITFQKIRDLERTENSTKELQQLPVTLIEDVAEYLEKKQVKEAEDAMEVESIKRTLRRIFEIREKKILNLVSFSTTTDMPVKNMIRDEAEMFQKIKNHVQEFREINIKRLDRNKPIAKMYQVLENLEQFVGTDEKIYTLKKHDILTFPDDMAELLITKGIIKECEKKDM
ncbi:MAG: DNA replication complex GINS family protein [Candidatus Aenigmarchaeota archaeon]|nr:DNA replication complex GINS family protein [Candidatus Aenigmarchaeota archaeon]